jgi:hypothetical protein
MSGLSDWLLGDDRIPSVRLVRLLVCVFCCFLSLSLLIIVVTLLIIVVTPLMICVTLLTIVVALLIIVVSLLMLLW